VEPVGIHHVSVNVDDVMASVAFYTEVLGFTLRSDRPDFGFDGAWLDAGDEQLHLIRGQVPVQAGQHFAVRVTDIDAVVKEIRGRGIEVSDPISVGRSRQAFLSDPSGNGVELHEVGP
jgi:catechol 2,3-dioxygenase-like lactoylglutathione lyase family enzyme